MALVPGTQLGPYEIASLIGVGGMGEVYRATDTNLGRDVAIKVLPEAFAQDAERLARFEREAKTLASLNHPNIAIIHGFEKADNVRALVMELVEGLTLADHIQKGLIPLEEALTIARQIAAALEAAHEQGIIHRDLKPANIKIRPDGTVKVLDFGLAKLAGQPGEQGGSKETDATYGLTISPTITNAMMTGAGVILGTAAYMSPEQARGRAADKRSDVWAYGAVLFEMLSGRRPFEGEDISETLAFVLTKAPDWTMLPASVPASVRTLVMRCLERDRRRRVADVSTASFVLDEALSRMAAAGGDVDYRQAGDPTHVQERIESAVTAARREIVRRRVIPISAAAALVAVVAGVGVWMFGRSGSPPPVVRFTFTLPEGQVLANARQAVGISPDGGRVLYSNNGRLYLRRLSELDAREVPGAEKVAAQSPAFSPDGSAIAFFSNTEGMVKRIPLSGGGADPVCPAVDPADLTWDSSGIVFADLTVPGGSWGIFRCPSTGGQREQLLVASNPGEIFQGPQILPGGSAVLFTAAQRADENWDRAEVVLQSLTTGSRKTLTAGSDPRYIRTGHVLYALGGRMLAVAFDADREEVFGGPVTVVDGVRRSLASGSAHLAVSDTGTLVYVPGPTGAFGDSRLAIADRAGTVMPLPIQAGTYVDVRASRDGARLAVSSDNGKDAFVSVYELAGTSAMRRLTFGDRSRFPIWSPTGEEIAYQSDRGGELSIFSQRADGTGPVRRLTTPGKGEAHVPESWSPDGKHISFAVIKGSGFSLWMLALEKGTIAPFGGVQSTSPIGSVFSPDGQWMAYTWNPGVANPAIRGVYIQRVPAGERYLVPKNETFDFQPVWSLNRPNESAELVYVPTAASGKMVVRSVTTRPTVRFGNPQTFPARITGSRIGSQTRAYDILPDGRFVGPIRDTDDKPSSDTREQIHVVVNWTEELKTRVPTNK